MPHTWWHQWDYLPDTQEPAADPTVFQEYLFPAARAVGSGIAQIPGVMPALQGVGAGLNFVHGRIVEPTINQAIQPIPFNWELNEGVTEQSPWYRPISRFTEGRMVPNVDQYVTPEGDFSLGGAFDQFMNINPIGVVAGTVLEGLDIQEPWKGNTRQNQRINTEVKRIEQETGQQVTEQQRREIGQDLYPTLPYARGLAEELPYFLIPPAKGVRTAAQAARTGATAANNPALRAGLRGVELGLKPLEVVEETLASAITAPFKSVGRRTVPDVSPATGVAEVGGRTFTTQSLDVPVEDVMLPAGAGMPSTQFGGQVIDDVSVPITQQADEIITPQTTVDLPETPQIVTPTTTTPDDLIVPRQVTETVEFYVPALTRAGSDSPIKRPITNKNFTVRTYETIKSAIPDISGIFSIEKVIAKAPFVQNLSKFGNDASDVLGKTLKNRFPNMGRADSYLRFINKWHAPASSARQMTDYIYGPNGKPIREIKTAQPKRSTLAGGELSPNGIPKPNPQVAENIHRFRDVAAGQALMRTKNVYRMVIEPYLAQGGNGTALNRYLQALQIKNVNDVLSARATAEGRDYTRTNPNVYNPETKQWDIAVTDKELGDWIDRAKVKEAWDFTDEQFDFLEETAARIVGKDAANKRRYDSDGKPIIGIYEEARERLYKAGIISEENFKYYNETWSHYIPTEYLEYAEKATKGTSLGGTTNVIDDGFRRLSEDLDVRLSARDPLDAEVLAANLMRTELKIANNTQTKNIVNLYIYDGKQRLKEVTDEFIKEDGSLKKAIPDPDNKTGYFVFFENGKRRVFGGMDGGPVPELMWQEVNGKNGLAAIGDNAALARLAASNGWFRSVYTTYSPLFWVRNAIIDMFTVQLKADTRPDEVLAQMARSLNKNIMGKEDRFNDFMGTLGGWAEGSGYINSTKLQKSIYRELSKAGHNDVATVVSSGKQLNLALDNSIRNKVKEFFPQVGGAIESAPRIAVARKSFVKYLNELTDSDGIKINGKAELNRLMKLPKEQFDVEVLENWRGTGVGLIEQDFAQRAAINSIEATIDFARGGSQFRNWNNYILFLNAAVEGTKLPFRALGIDLHPVIRPVKDPVPNGPMYEFGTVNEQIVKYAKAVNNLTVSPATLGFGYREARGITGKGFDTAMGPRQAAAAIGGAVYAYWAIQEGWNKLWEYEGTPLYYDIPEYIRYNSLIFMLPPKRDEAGELILDPATERPKPQYVVIPHKLREWNSVFAAVTYLSESTDADTKFDKAAWGKEVWKSTFPINEIPIPEVFNVAGEQITGYDTWRQSQIVEDEDAPLSEQYTRRTSNVMRKAAGVMEEAPLENIEFLDNIVSSPDRFQHLYESIFGSTGQMVTDVADWTLQTLNELRGVEKRPMEDKVAEYREMTRTERTEFRNSLTPDEYEEFQKELREPDKVSIPFIEGLKKSFYPERGGGLERAGRERTKKAFPEISSEQSSKAGIAASSIRKQLRDDQVESDSKLARWARGDKVNGITPQEWRQAKSEKYLKYEGAQLGITEIFKNSIQAADDETRDNYYNLIYNSAGSIPDSRSAADLLLVGYYAIELPEDPEASDWDMFFGLREEYIESVRVNSEVRGDGLYDEFTRRLNVNDTEFEKAYDAARIKMKPYWDVGKNLRELGYQNINQQVETVWKEYLNSNRQTKYQMKTQYPYLSKLEERRSIFRERLVMQTPDLDETLVFWYGDFYTGVTLAGKAYHRQLYGVAGP